MKELLSLITNFEGKTNFSKFVDFSIHSQTEAEAELQHGPDRYDTAIKQYAGFVPNHIFLHKPPADVIAYAFLQFCDFFSIKVTKQVIDKRLAITYGTFRNCLKRLRDKELVKKQSDGSYLFNILIDDHPKKWVTSKELQLIHKGYWMELDILGNKDISNITKMVYTAIKSISKSTRKINQAFIGGKIARGRQAVNRSVKELVKHGLIEVKNTCDGVNIYSIVEGKKMTSETVCNKSCHQNGTSICHQNGTHSNNISNKNNIDHTGIRKNEILKNLSVDNDLLKLQGVINEERRKYMRMHNEIQEIENKKTKALERLTQATIEKDIDEMRRIGEEHSYFERTKIKLEGKAETLKEKVANPEYSLRKYTINEKNIKISAESQQAMAEAVEKVLPDFKDERTTRAAYCLLLNSLYLKYNSYYFKRFKKNYKIKQPKRSEISMEEALRCTISDLSNKRFDLHNDMNLGVKNLQIQQNNARLGGEYKDRFEYLSA